MIIGISGKKQSGKDTVGKIIQYLESKQQKTYIGELVNPTLSFEQFISRHIITSWEIHKFANPLKDIICILTGCTRDQLEDENFKNSLLPDDWIRYGFADGFIKEYIGNGEMGTPIMNNKQCSKEKYEEEYRINWQTAYKTHLTYRQLLQYLGTDLLRNKLHENVWVNAIMSKYKSKTYTTFPENAPIRGIPTEEDEVKYGKIITEYPNWIITDVRFPNEAQAIKDRGGFIIRVNRNWGNTDNLFNQHPSETALDNATFDYTIDNNGSIEELIEKVKVILIKEKLL